MRATTTCAAREPRIAALVAFVVLGQDPGTWSVAMTWNAVIAAFRVVLALPSLVLAQAGPLAGV
ncbi:MAG: hypothetical protein PSX37_05690 [bacterium]|nr:hypothetical protein [bacterium]